MKKLVVLVLLLGCKHDQTYREAWQTICDAPKHVPAESDPAERATKLATWMTAHVTNPQAKKDLSSLGGYEGDKTAIVKQIVIESGGDPSKCLMLTQK